MLTFENDTDTIEQLAGAKIHHGELNKRVYLMDFGNARPKNVITAMEKLATANRYTKIFAKIPANRKRGFINAGYDIEGRIPGYYHGEEDALLLGKYFSATRKLPTLKQKLKYIVQVAEKKAETATEPKPLSEGTIIRECTKEDITQICQVYRVVFPTYPFPIHAPEYVEKIMDSHVSFFCIEEGERILALASAECDVENKAVELTDFAVWPAWTGRDSARHLIKAMEEKLAAEGYIASYTIARAESYPINIAFARSGYEYNGFLPNNTNISGKIESMNVWTKKLN